MTSFEKWIDYPNGLKVVSPNDSVGLSIENRIISLPSAPESSVDPASRKQITVSGVRGVFSASVLQTFQIVNLSAAGTDRIQNFRFAPMLSSRSLSYKFTAGVEKKHTQLFLSYAYFRTWNEYEIGTNQVSATRVGENQYNMVRLGEKHVEDERSHLVGLGVRQNFIVPQNFLKNYEVCVGAEYTRLIPKGQDLLWGSVGMYKQVYHFGGSRLAVGPYMQFSLMEGRVEGQSWKSRPYQIGFSLHLKVQ